jgi:putative transposase
VKYAWIAINKARWPITLACDVLGVSASGYFERLRRNVDDKPSKPGASNRMSDERLLVEIRAIRAEVRQEYGWPRMWKELVARGHRVGQGTGTPPSEKAWRLCQEQAQICCHHRQ